MGNAGRAALGQSHSQIACNPSVPIHASSLLTMRAGENTASQLYGPAGGLQRDMQGNPLQPSLNIQRTQRAFPNGVKYWDVSVRISVPEFRSPSTDRVPLSELA